MDKCLELKDKLHDQDVDPDDRVLAYARYTRHSGLLVAHNLDPHSVRSHLKMIGTYPPSPLPARKGGIKASYFSGICGFDPRNANAFVTISRAVRVFRWLLREIACPIDQVPGVLFDRVDLAPVYDTYKFTTDRAARVTLADEGVSIELQPLQSAVVKLLFRSA